MLCGARGQVQRFSKSSLKILWRNCVIEPLTSSELEQQSMKTALRKNVMISVPELRHIIERGFLPLSCSCTQNLDGSLMIKVTEPTSGSVELLVTGVSTAPLNSSRAIAELIGELRSEMAARKTNFDSGECRAQGH